eukprot:scaffold647_cov150-Skeletonema_menzelii.AAC.5
MQTRSVRGCSCCCSVSIFTKWVVGCGLWYMIHHRRGTWEWEWEGKARTKSYVETLKRRRNELQKLHGEYCIRTSSVNAVAVAAAV